ncbi:hypothetical protein BC939DRAFT_460008 [Gamsiella multidivaricata]|uniref:uncharacterized protein n=1 Tax=Gamsiella multidivaricata TaxID=101098 RepID=UPI00222079BD|nr:uncharacterized protein BC939DRAFT_460008 [Gamsiella multidivaricata]KAI7819522.1 hypothetical protein BC939DRAFT_460008 [Gamsiella multidivaricata]
MDALLDWVTDPENDARLRNVGRVSGTKLCDIYREVALLVNQQCGTEWKSDEVRSNIRGIEKKYKDAHTLAASTGEGHDGSKGLLERIREICPPYDRLYLVYASSVVKNPLPLKQSVPAPAPEESFFASDLDNDDDADDAPEDERRATRQNAREASVATNSSARSSKAKSRTSKANSIDILSNRLQEIKEMCRTHGSAGSSSSTSQVDSWIQQRFHELKEELDEYKRENRELKDQLVKIQLDHCKENEKIKCDLAATKRELELRVAQVIKETQPKKEESKQQ